MAVAGVILGCVLAPGLARLMNSQLFGVTPNDPLTFACVSLILVAVSLLACWIPAMRAAQLEPMLALRYE